MIQRPQGFTPPPVSKRYFYDWQYAVNITTYTGLQFISLFLLIVPSLLDVEKTGLLVIPPGLWFASVAFIVALLFVYFFCPKFIREYRDFGQYKAKLNSHRWMVWEFYNNLSTLEGWKTIVKETVAKGISLELAQMPNNEIKAALASIMESSGAEDAVTVYKPQNFNRDIYLPIRLQDQKFVLFLEEDDPKLPEKEKELFWILFSQAAKEKPVARAIFWILIYIAVIVGGVSIFYSVSQIALK